MIIKKSAQEIEKLRVVNRHVGRLLQELLAMAKPGITTLDLARYAEQYIRSLGAIPTFKDQADFPACICTSVNEIVVHGIPNTRPLKDGDIISIDTGMQLDGWCGDSCATVIVGTGTPELQRLRDVTKKSLDIGIENALIGNRLGVVGQAIQTYVEHEGFGVVRSFCGHGIGRGMHEDPEVRHFGPKKSGPVLEEGMVICIEPMVTAGTWRLELMSDGWGARTVDLKPSAQFEHTVAITKSGPVILSLPD
jgi:methionyl aminopeptidase